MTNLSTEMDSVKSGMDALEKGMHEKVEGLITQNDK